MPCVECGRGVGHAPGCQRARAETTTSATVSAPLHDDPPLPPPPEYIMLTTREHETLVRERDVYRNAVQGIATQHLHRASAPLDLILNEPFKCSDPECLVCGSICCPHGEPLHFHRDGCPSCYMDDRTLRLVIAYHCVACSTTHHFAHDLAAMLGGWREDDGVWSCPAHAPKPCHRRRDPASTEIR